MNKRWHQVGFVTVMMICCANLTMAQAPPLVKAFHPDGPMPSYEVATIKPSDPAVPFGTTLRRYIGSAYGVPSGSITLMGQEDPNERVIGGPAWIDKDRYDFKGKAPEELAEAMKKMSNDDRTAQNRMMQQSLLAERFHLKVHFETREMPVFELVPAKGGLKITAVDLPSPPSAMPQAPPKPGGLMPAGSVSLSIAAGGATVFKARAITVEMLANMVRSIAPEIGGRPVVDRTGFKGNFDLNDFRFLGTVPPQIAGGAANNSTDPPDVPSLSHELEEKLGIKLVAAKGQVEVVVIDSIDRPTEN